jgi:hypothetical protein
MCLCDGHGATKGCPLKRYLKRMKYVFGYRVPYCLSCRRIVQEQSKRSKIFVDSTGPYVESDALARARCAISAATVTIRTSLKSPATSSYRGPSGSIKIRASGRILGYFYRLFWTPYNENPYIYSVRFDFKFDNFSMEIKVSRPQFWIGHCNHSG